LCAQAASSCARCRAPTLSPHAGESSAGCYPACRELDHIFDDVRLSEYADSGFFSAKRLARVPPSSPAAVARHGTALSVRARPPLGPSRWPTFWLQAQRRPKTPVRIRFRAGRGRGKHTGLQHERKPVPVAAHRILARMQQAASKIRRLWALSGGASRIATAFLARQRCCSRTMPASSSCLLQV